MSKFLSGLSDDDSSGIGSWNEIYGFIYCLILVSNVFTFNNDCAKKCVSKNKSTVFMWQNSTEKSFMWLAFFANISYFLNWNFEEEEESWFENFFLIQNFSVE